MHAHPQAHLHRALHQGTPYPLTPSLSNLGQAPQTTHLLVLVVPCAVVRLPAAVQLHHNHTRHLVRACVLEHHLLLDVLSSRHAQQRGRVPAGVATAAAAAVSRSWCGICIGIRYQRACCSTLVARQSPSLIPNLSSPTGASWYPLPVTTQPRLQGEFGHRAVCCQPYADTQPISTPRPLLCWHQGVPTSLLATPAPPSPHTVQLDC